MPARTVRPAVAPDPPAWRRRRLLLVAMGLPAVEAAVLHALHLSEAVALAPQVTAPAPFGLFHDLRWLLVFHTSWWAFALQLVLLVAFRSGLDAAIVWAAWPAGVSRPSGRRFLAATAASVAAGAVLVSPAAVLLFAAAAVSLSWLVFAAVPAFLLVAALVHHGAVVGWWWRRLPPLRSAGWVLLWFLVLTLASAAMSLTPAVVSVAVAALAGLGNAWAWSGLVRAVVQTQRRSSRVPVVPLVLSAGLVLMVAGAALGFHLRGSPGDLRRTAEQAVRMPDPVGAEPVLLVEGFSSDWDGEPAPGLGPRFGLQRFSYAGLGGDGRPLHYEPADTARPLDELVPELWLQVQAAHARSGRPVHLVASSEGTVVVRAFLARFPAAPVGRVVLLSPILRPGRVYYPPAGTDGFGVVAAWELRAVSALITAISPFDVEPDLPIIRSMLDHAGVLRDGMMCPAPGVEIHALLPLASSAAAPPDGGIEIPTTVLPTFHGSVSLSGVAADAVAVALAGGRPPTTPGLQELGRLIRGLSAGWQVPELPLDLNPVWPEHDRPGCDGGEVPQPVVATLPGP